jgi:L-lactate dehydrogenase complex protein LldF
MGDAFPFADRAGAAIHQGRTDATNAGARRVHIKRLNAAADYPAMDGMRDLARSIRLHTLSRLDEYLDRFATEFEANGGVVHWADDAAEASRIVVDIARRRGATKAIKAKSMVTEEIHLNQALAAAGIEVVETDLGEFIVQLSGDRPSHIIAPVLHKTRFEIGELFRDELGAGYTDVPEELNAIARSHLRPIFLGAHLGISGVNFAVADGGAIATVTNEGNARFCTTAPDVHIALMGMERIVPSHRHLAVMMEVLARSGTGQRLSVYTNVMRGPRGRDDPDGPEELHVVIVDNGRSGMLGGSLAEILTCIRCGACLNACPVYRSAGGHAYGSTYPGPIGSVVSPGLFGLEEHFDLAFASTLCGACKDACPVRIDIPRLLVDLRHEAAAEGLTPQWLDRTLRLYARAATNPTAWRAALRAGGVLGRVAGGERWIRSIPGPARGWTEHRDLTPLPQRSFRSWWEARNG